MSDKNIYIYGFIHTNEEETFNCAGIEGGEVYTQAYLDIAAVVSSSPSTQFDSLPKETLLLHLAAYQAVIESVMRRHHIIPMKFGTVATGKEEVNRILKRGYNRIKLGAMAMENKMELDVVAMWSDINSVLRKIGEEAEIKRLKAEAESKSSEQRMEAGINLGRMVKASLDERRKRGASGILKALGNKSENHFIHDVMDDSMIMNAAFLIDKDNKKGFESEIDDLDEKYQGELSFRIVGPLPPYSFCTFEVRKANFSEISAARKVLGLGEKSTALEIRETYWELSKKFHPDRHPGDADAQKRFENITKAYRLLSDYCEWEQCSFNEEDVTAWLSFRQVTLLGAYT